MRPKRACTQKPPATPLPQKKARQKQNKLPSNDTIPQASCSGQQNIAHIQSTVDTMTLPPANIGSQQNIAISQGGVASDIQQPSSSILNVVPAQVAQVSLASCSGLNPSSTQLSICEMLIKMNEDDQIGERHDAVEVAERDAAEVAEPDAAPNVVQDEVPVEPDEVFWMQERTFENEAECKAFIAGENSWTFLRKISQTRGYKWTYRCRFCKAHGKPCKAGIYVIFNTSPDDTLYRLYRKTAAHDHETSDNKNTRVQDDVKQMIHDMIDEGKTKKQISHILRRKNDIKQPTSKQITSVIKTYRKKVFGESKITAEEIVAFCKANSGIPEEMDKAFVARCEVLIESSSESSDGSDDPPNPSPIIFRFIITTKRLLLNSMRSNIIHADTTYKMTIQRYPIIVIGTTDLDSNQHFHLLGMMISKTQTSEDFAFAFKAINDTIKKIADVEFAPKVLMADAAEAIHNGYRSVYGDDGTILMCYFHVMKKVDDYRLMDNGNRILIKADIRQLRMAWNRSIFDTGVKLFLLKWTEKEPAFVEKFEASWVKKNSNWFIGAHQNTPSTNNGLESFNGSLKIHQIHWRKEGLAAFKVRALQYISDRSSEYIMDKKTFQMEILVPKSTLKKGEKYATIKKINIKADQEQQQVRCFITSGNKSDENEISEDEISDFLAMAPESFDELKAKMSKFYMVTYNMSDVDWKKGKCTCATFHLEFMCTHITCIAYRLKLIKKEKSHVLEANAKPGRPKKATRALVID